MAKQSPKKKKKEKTALSAPRFHLHFLFSGSNMSEEELPGFAEKIPDEFKSRCSASILNGNESRELAELPSEAYIVHFTRGKWAGPDHLRPWFNLALPNDSRNPSYYKLRFRKKEKSSPSAIIYPAGVLSYLAGLGGTKDLDNPQCLLPILEDLGFKSKDLELDVEKSPDKKLFSPGNWIHARVLHLKWMTQWAVKEAGTGCGKKHFFYREHPLFRLAFLLTSLLVFVLLPILSLDAGLSGDDEKHYQHAAKVYRYYSEDDPAALNDPKNKLNFYGQSFDFFSYLLIRLFKLQDKPYEARHVMVALCGAAAMLCCALLVKRFAGYSGALLATVLMFLSPRFLGHSFNNPLDVPFALGYIFTIYHMVAFLQKLPRISGRSALWIAIGIAWTNGIRIGGLVLVPYLFMFAGLYLITRKWPWKAFSAAWWRFALRGFGVLLLISLTGYVLSLLTWPYALQDPINHPIKSFRVMSNIQVSIKVVYDGVIHWSDHLPWHYIPKNILNTVPALILLGCLASLFSWWSDRRKNNMAFWIFMLWFTVLFPVVFIIIRESNVYGGWRHMMFVYPSMLVLSALAIHSLLLKTRKGWKRGLAVGVVAAGLIHPLRHTIVNHPNTYIYFNEFSGGINKTYGSFETDYYTNSLAPATDYFIKNILPNAKAGENELLEVTSNANISYYFRKHRDKVHPFYSRYYDRGKYNWDYAILYCNYIHPYQLKNGLWPPRNTIHTIKVDSVVVAAIVKRASKEDHIGSKALQAGIRERNAAKLAEGLEHLENAVALDNHNEAAYLELGNAYIAFLRFDDARKAMDRLLGIYPDYDKAYNLKGYTWLVESEVKQDPELIDKAIATISQAVKINYKFYSGYYNLGLCYAAKRDRGNAEYYLKQAIRYNGKFKAAYVKLAELYDSFGDKDMAAQVRERIKRL